MWTSAAILALAGAVGAEPPAKPPPYPDLSEPKAAAFSLAVALTRGDVKVAREAYAGEDKEFLEYLDALGATRANVDRVEQMITARFGEFAWKVFAGGADFDWKLPVGDKGDSKASMALVVALAEVKQDGDQATLKLSKDFEVRLKKTDTGWKVTAWLPVNPLAFVNFHLADATFKDLAAELEQGKHAKVYDVVAAFARIQTKHTAELFKELDPKEKESKDAKKK